MTILKFSTSASGRPLASARRLARPGPARPRARMSSFDFFFGTALGQFVMLALSAAALIVSGAVAWHGATGDAIDEAFWLSWGIFFDPGTQTGLEGGASMSRKLVVLLWSVLGFVYNLVVLGRIVDAIRVYMDSLRLPRREVSRDGRARSARALSLSRGNEAE